MMHRGWIGGLLFLFILLGGAALGGGYLYGESIKVQSQRANDQLTDDLIEQLMLVAARLGRTDQRLAMVDTRLTILSAASEAQEAWLNDIDSQLQARVTPSTTQAVNPAPALPSPGAWLGSHSPPWDFCTFTPCIASFWNGRGYVVQCGDGLYSKSGGIQGACSSHGGVAR